MPKVTTALAKGAKDCLIKLRKLQYVYLRLTSPDHVRVTHEARIAETLQYDLCN